MKNYLIAILAITVMAGFMAQAEPQFTVTTTAMDKIVPDRTVKNAAAFVAGASVAQGAYIKNTQSPYQIFMALNAGTNGVTAPANVSGTVSSGSITYYRVRLEDRKGVLISNVGTNAGYFTVGYPGTGSTPGVKLDVGSVVTIEKEVQDAVYGGTNATFSVQEY